MNLKVKYILSIIIILIIGTLGYINTNYLYSPVSFEQISGFNQVVWNDFERPTMLELEIKENRIIEYLLQNEVEIRYIYDELTNSDEIDVSDYKGDRYIFFQFASGNLTDESFKGFLTVEINRDGVAKISEDLYLQVSPGLMNYFASIENRDTVLYLLNGTTMEKKD